MHNENFSLLKQERIAQGWTQKKFAKVLKVTVRTVIRWENNQAIPHHNNLAKICLILGKTAQELGFANEAETENAETQTRERLLKKILLGSLPGFRIFMIIIKKTEED